MIRLYLTSRNCNTYDCRLSNRQQGQTLPDAALAPAPVRRGGASDRGCRAVGRMGRIATLTEPWAWSRAPELARDQMRPEELPRRLQRLVHAVAVLRAALTLGQSGAPGGKLYQVVLTDRATSLPFTAVLTGP
jgi:hypothetical protein